MDRTHRLGWLVLALTVALVGVYALNSDAGPAVVALDTRLDGIQRDDGAVVVDFDCRRGPAYTAGAVVEVLTADDRMAAAAAFRRLAEGPVTGAGDAAVERVRVAGDFSRDDRVRVTVRLEGAAPGDYRVRFRDTESPVPFERTHVVTVAAPDDMPTTTAWSH